MSIEKEFKAVYADALIRLNAKNAEAIRVISELEAICEETGIPYYASVSPLGQTYQPNNFQDKWGKLNDETVDVVSKCDGRTYKETLWEKLTGGESQGEYEGWQHSSIC